MRMAFTFAFALLAGMTASAVADTGPVVVIPSRAGVPIVIDGVDASFAVVEGDWGLGKSVHVSADHLWRLAGGDAAARGALFPAHRTGVPVTDATRSTRRRALLPGDGSYYRSWGAESPRGYEQEYVPPDPPPIIYAPQFRRSRSRSGADGAEREF